MSHLGTTGKPCRAGQNEAQRNGCALGKSEPARGQNEDELPIELLQSVGEMQEQAMQRRGCATRKAKECSSLRAGDDGAAQSELEDGGAG